MEDKKMLVCEEDELEYWEQREKQIKSYIDGTKYLTLPEDIQTDFKRRLSVETSVCLEQENRIINADMMD
jgi:hypothetical protein